MKTIRLIRQNSSLFAYLQIDGNIPRRFRIDTKHPSRISLETAQLLYTRSAIIGEINKQLIQNAEILSSTPLLLKEYTSRCTLFGKTLEHRFPISTDADSEDVVGKDLLSEFPDFHIVDDEAHFDNNTVSGRYTRNENYCFRQYENTNILDTMTHLFAEQHRKDKNIRKPYHSNELIQMMDMALDNALFYYKEHQFAEAELILKRINEMFSVKIDFDCRYSSPFHYSPTGKFLFLRGLTALERSYKSYCARNATSYRNQAFSDLVKAASFFLPESQFSYTIQGTLKSISFEKKQ